MKRTRRCLNVVGCALTTCVLFASCATGERPTFEEERPVPTNTTGNAEIDTVLGLLDTVDGSQFTAGYSIETKFNTVSSTGVVVQADDSRLSITVENDERRVRFLVDDSGERTCDLLTDECEASLNDARISDTQLSHEFYGPSFASRLRADADRRISDPTLYEEAIAGQDATCVDLDVSGGTKTYCALASGALARFVGADVGIDLTSYSPEPDTSKFEV